MLDDDLEDMILSMFEGISSNIFKNQIKNATCANITLLLTKSLCFLSVNSFSAYLFHYA